MILPFCVIIRGGLPFVVVQGHRESPIFDVCYMIMWIGLKRVAVCSWGRVLLSPGLWIAL